MLYVIAGSTAPPLPSTYTAALLPILLSPEAAADAPGLCHATDPAAWDAVAMITGQSREGLAGARLLVDAGGWLRALKPAAAAAQWDDPAVQDRYTQLRLDLADHMALYETYTEKLRQGAAIGPDVAMLKIWQSELFQRITDLMMEVAGENAALLDPLDGDSELHAPGMFLLARPATIYGGSSEIMRNLLARSVLDLPV